LGLREAAGGSQLGLLARGSRRGGGGLLVVMQEPVDVGAELEQLAADGSEGGDLRAVFQRQSHAALIGWVVRV
jgi:hypothetical protein